MFNAFRTGRAPAQISGSGAGNAFENPMHAAAQDARRILAAPVGTQTPEAISLGARSLSANLNRALQAPPPANMALARDLHEVQLAIDGLRQGLARLEQDATGLPGSSAQGPHLSAQARASQKDIDTLQHALDEAIKGSIVTSRLSGNAMKDFLKQVHPQPERLIEHAARFLSAAQQSDLADSSKRLQRYAGLARPSDRGKKLEDLATRMGVKKRPPTAAPHAKAAALSWAATRVRDMQQQNRGVAKLDAAYRTLLEDGEVKGLASALNMLVDGLHNLPTRELRHQAFSSSMLKTLARTALPGKERSLDLQDQVLHILRDLAARHGSGKVALPVEQRAELATAMAHVYTAHLERSPDFADLRMWFVDKDVRDHMNGKVDSDPPPFDVERDVLDLRHVAREDEDGAPSQSHTRKAQMMDIDEARNRVKEIAYGERAAASEATATQVIALSGHATPKTRLARYDDMPRAIASQLIPGFRDLGQFVLDAESVTGMIEKEWGKGGLDKLQAALQQASEATAELADLNREPPLKTAKLDDPQVKKIQDAIRTRFQARKQIFEMLPTELHQKIGKAQFMSQWIADVDFLNFEWFNAGFSGDKVAVVLDEGNSLDQGFGGKQKGAANLAKANDRARNTDPYKPNEVRQEHHAFGPEIAASRTNVGANARSIPVAAALRTFIEAEARLAEAGMAGQLRDVPPHEARAYSGQMEAAFQLGLVPDQAIRIVVARNWPDPTDPSVPFPEDAQVRRTPQELGDILIARREALFKKFKPEELARWKDKNPELARSAYAQTAAAVAGMTGICIPEDSLAEQHKTQPDLVRRHST